jgi:putative acetyltransferase
MVHTSRLSEEIVMTIETAPTVALRERHDGWTPAKQRLFLEHLAETGVVKEAAQRVGMSEQGAYKLRLRKDAQPFSQGWKAALHIGRQRLIGTAYDRAINGTAKPVFYKGEQIGETRTFSDKLLMMLIANPAAAGVTQSKDVMKIVASWEDWVEGIENGFPASVIDEDEEWYHSPRVTAPRVKPRRAAHSPKLPKLPDERDPQNVEQKGLPHPSSSRAQRGNPAAPESGLPRSARNDDEDMAAIAHDEPATCHDLELQVARDILVAQIAGRNRPLCDNEPPVPPKEETPTMHIISDDLTNPDVAALLQRHHEGMLANSPPESCHVLDLDALRAPEISFWTAWDGPELAGCGALKTLDAAHGEIKSMRTHDDHLRKGVGAAILTHIIAHAKARGMAQLSLETGSSPPFQPALDLYTRFGFTYCAPFGGYREDPFSRFMTLDLMPNGMGVHSD